MRIALFTETFLPKMDGIVRVVLRLLDHLNESGIETMVFCPKLGEGVDYYDQTQVHAIGGMTLPWYPELRMCPPSPTAYRTLKDFDPDVAHFIHPVTVGIPGMIMAKRLEVPTLASFHLDLARMADHHNMPFLRPVADYLTRIIFNWADYALAPSKLIQQEMLDLGVHDVGLWKRGVDAVNFNPKFRSDAMRYELSDGHPDEKILLYVGRLSEEKKVDQLKALVERLPGVRLALVGDGPARESLQEHFAGTPTKFMGYLRGEALFQAYASADVFVFPSALETFGLVVVEAMAAGIPVVSSRVGGIPDVVEEGKTGYTFEVGDTEKLVAGVQQTIRDTATMHRMGHDARAFAETQSWDSMMEEVIEHYARLIEMKIHETRATA